MSPDKTGELVFLALGGAGEIGMNLNLYGLGPAGKETWVMIDLGITFGGGQVPGVDVILPDPGFIVEHRDRLAGLVLTHAHEDHLGAVPYLWQRLQCPVYATPFTISILKRKLAETDFADQVEIIEVPLGGRFTVGPFDMELITLTHSIPESNAIAIRTPVGTVLHTGDWKFDPDPVVGDAADVEAKQATATRPSASAISSERLFSNSASDPDSPGVKTLVESQTSASTPSSPSRSSASTSAASPTTGSGSNFQSPV